MDNRPTFAEPRLTVKINLRATGAQQSSGRHFFLKNFKFRDRRTPQLADRITAGSQTGSKRRLRPEVGHDLPTYLNH